MAFQIVYWNSPTKICCGAPLPVDVIICCDASLVAQQNCPGGGQTNFSYPGIGGQLLEVYVLTNDCNRGPVYRYSIRYADEQLVPGAKLTTQDLQGILCLNCLTTYIRGAAGDEISLVQNDDGTLTLVSQHGCRYTFNPTGENFVDSDSIEFEKIGDIVTAKVKQSGESDNILSILPDGLYVPPTPDFIDSVADTTTVDLDVTAGLLTADVIISPTGGNQLTDDGNGLYVPTVIIPDQLITSVLDSDTIDLSVVAGVLTAEVIQCAIKSDGWTPACDTWTFASANSINVLPDATIKYAVGDKIRLVQGVTTKYFYVISVSVAALGITAGSNYTLINAPITDPFYSHAMSPVGFPQHVAYAPTFGGFATPPATPEIQWSLFGTLAHFLFATGDGVSNATTFTISLLVPMLVTVNPFSARAGGFSGTDNSTFKGDILATIPSSAPTAVQLFTGSGATGWTAANNKAAVGNVVYNIA